MIRHVPDFGITEDLVDSDHRTIKCVLRVAARRVGQVVTPRQKLDKTNLLGITGHGQRRGRY